MVYLGIGSNLSSSFGSRFQNINFAISYIQEEKIDLIKKSSFYETFSFPNKEDPKFINIVIAVKTNLSPQELMQRLLFIEQKLERKRFKKNDPRTCDIDIIDYNNKIINFKLNKFSLKIPHQSLSTRNFVLHPLKEICPNWTHPVSKKNIDVLIKNLKKTNNDITKLTENDINNYVK
tara:strand:+ start:204 stop:734 length:531 start_codon:yes stop_codon:yes gene_type:complete